MTPSTLPTLLFDRRVLPVLIALAALAALPLGASPFTVGLAMKIMILAIFALSLELLVGQTGLVSLGHAAFYGISAYTAARLTPSDGPALIWWLWPSALLAAGAFAAVVGALSLRTRGIYFIMITLAFAQMAYFAVHDTPLGGGSDGVYLNFRPEVRIGSWVIVDLERGPALYYLTLSCLAGSWISLALVLRSRFGRALAGIRANEQRMRAAGFPTYPYKLTAFVLAAMLAGLAGMLHSLKDGYVNPEMLSWHHSGEVLVVVILGGLGHLRGALIGAVALTLLKELFQSEALFGPLALRWQLSLGLTIIAFVALLPRGLIGLPALLGQRSAQGSAQGGDHDH